MRSFVLVASSCILLACNTGPKDTGSVAPEPKPAATTTTAAAVTESTIRLGAPIEASTQKVALVDVAKNPDAFVGKTFATTGTVTAVCQHAGCWMEIKDEQSEAHIRMAGHSFFVPRTASGHKARVMATLTKTPEPEPSCGHAKDGKNGCRAEAEEQLGHPVAKLELVAKGVEIM